jgi:phosphate transport system substrate-binding protein
LEQARARVAALVGAALAAGRHKTSAFLDSIAVRWLSETELRVRALETVLTEKGYINLSKLLSRAYLDVVWDGNSKPVEMVKSGQAHIAVTGTETADLSATPIAWDGIGVLVHLSNFTKEVTKQQVADIFSGKITLWSELGGLETKILVIDRPRNQNIRDAFESQLGITGKITGAAKVIGSDEQVVKIVVGTLPPLSAIAYLSLSQGLSVVSGGVPVRLLPIDKVEPEGPTVKDGRYPLRRPVLLLSKKEPHPLAEAFTQFALSPAGQQLIAEMYIPMKEK